MLVSPMTHATPTPHARQPMTPSSTPSSNKRPKLSLQTASVPIAFGKSSTALAISTANDTGTPTMLNTFSNAYSIPHRPSPSTQSQTPWTARLTQSPAPSTINTKKDTQPQPYAVKLPLGIKPILRNSLVQSSQYPASSASPRSATRRRVFFPVAKKVSFRTDTDLEEIVQTTKYVAKHSDLSESESEDESASGSDGDQVTHADAGDDESRPSTLVRVDSNITRQVRAEALRDRTSIPRTQKHSSTRRRKRKWEWTLGEEGTKPAGPKEQVGDDGGVSIEQEQQQDDKKGRTEPENQEDAITTTLEQYQCQEPERATSRGRDREPTPYPEDPWSAVSVPLPLSPEVNTDAGVELEVPSSQLTPE